MIIIIIITSIVKRGGEKKSGNDPGGMKKHPVLPDAFSGLYRSMVNCFMIGRCFHLRTMYRKEKLVMFLMLYSVASFRSRRETETLSSVEKALEVRL